MNVHNTHAHSTRGFFMVAVTQTASVAEEIANGDEIGTVQLSREKQLEISTVFRWIIKGLPAAGGGRVQLEAIKRGKTWLTSRAALRRFFSALPTNGDERNPSAPRSTDRS